MKFEPLISQNLELVSSRIHPRDKSNALCLFLFISYQPPHFDFAPISMTQSSSIPDIIEVFSDASLLYGAWINRDGTLKTFAIPERYQYSSFASEFYTASQTIRDTLPLGNRIHLYCDNLGVCQAIRFRYIAHPVKHALVEELLESLVSFIKHNHVLLSVRHIPSKLNPADPISRGPPTDFNRLCAYERLRSDALQSILS